MSKQHHFVVYRDNVTKKWEISDGGLMVDIDQPVYDTSKEEWINLTRIDDINEDSAALDDLRKRIDAE